MSTRPAFDKWRLCDSRRGVVKTWAKTQGPVALSSGDAQYYAMIKGALEGIGLQTLPRDLGWDVKLRLHVDSSAAKAIASRQGLGKLRHLEVRHLWLQDAVQRALGFEEGSGPPPKSIRLTDEGVVQFRHRALSTSHGRIVCENFAHLIASRCSA